MAKVRFPQNGRLQKAYDNARMELKRLVKAYRKKCEKRLNILSLRSRMAAARRRVVRAGVKRQVRQTRGILRSMGHTKKKA